MPGEILVGRTMDPLLGALLYSAFALFIILDPLLSIPLFLEMTKEKPREFVVHQAWIAIGVAGALMYLFLVFNFVIFDMLGITVASFQVAGGIILFLLGMQQVLGIALGDMKACKDNAACVVIGTPLLCGPGTLTTVLLLSHDYGLILVGVAIAISLAATWLVLRYSRALQRLVGALVIEIMAKVLGMFVAAIAVQIIFEGIQALL
ncbi:MAG: MarC family protein [Methanomicrobiales archaeon]|nr:MarC family protein [Methanomicrobiales archaeon]